VLAVSPTTEDSLKRDFKRSRWFGLGGVFVVGAGAAAIALIFGQGNANPTGAYIAIFVLIFGFVAGLLYLQRSDLDTAETRAKKEASGPVSEVTDPTTANSRSLIHALAIGPVDDTAIEDATDYTWGLGRSSISGGGVIMVLVACAVIPWQLFQTYWTLYLFTPLIIGYAGYMLSKVMASGGSLAPLYALSEPTMTPLGLTITETPTVQTSPRVAGAGTQKQITGTATYEGERHGRNVRLRLGSKTTTQIAGSYPGFTIRNRSGKLQPAANAPAAVKSVVAPLAASPLWTGVNVHGGEDGIVVERKDNRSSWMCDLWLAERLADAF
jgi:hypothetical protein